MVRKICVPGEAAMPWDEDRLGYQPKRSFAARLHQRNQKLECLHKAVCVLMLISEFDKHSMNFCLLFVVIDRSRRTFSSFSGRSALRLAPELLSLCFNPFIMPLRGSGVDSQLNCQTTV